jgi:NAD(P)-dependent dehydrogenase (short-subunit alcohol dehydrogenase family)
VSTSSSGEDLEGRRIALVTGATGAIGKAIARRLAATPDMAVVLVVRDLERGREAAGEIIRMTGNRRVYLRRCDLALRSDIESLAASWLHPLHILINNAAQTPRRRELSTEGVELQWATNVLGYFRMIRAFTSALATGAPARVVNVASYWAGGLDLRDPEFNQRSYHNDAAYRQSKQANRMLSARFAEILRPHGIAVYACHPGDVNSRLSNDLGFGGHESPDQGADTPVWLATSPDVAPEESGKYFEARREQSCPFSRDAGVLDALWQVFKKYD